MNANYVCERGTSRSNKHKYEEEIARRWWALPLNSNLPLSNGERCELLYAGRQGGSPGPDIRDAVLNFSRDPSRTGYTDEHSQQAGNVVGDVEIHIRATDWFAHQHHTDVRYNNVMLHIVLVCDGSRPTLRQDGTTVPTCSLNDIPFITRMYEQVDWPCHHVIAKICEDERAHLFTLAGTLRFEMKTQIFYKQLCDSTPSDTFNAYDMCLIPALAEALGFGRDRAFFRAAGLHLIGAAKTMPEPLGRAPQPSPLDTNRLKTLHTLVEKWRSSGAWNALHQALLHTSQDNDQWHHVQSRKDASVATPVYATTVLVSSLRNIFAGVGTARADILICNIVLPFAVAVAHQEDNSLLAEYARNLYITYPGLPSNQITRAMCKQLRLKREPRGACQQQGLHFIYAQTCREKHCDECIIGKQNV